MPVMKRSRMIVALGVFAAASLPGCGTNEGDDAAARMRELQESPAAAEAPAGAPVVVASLAWDVPPGWEPAAVTSPMRKAAFTIPGDDGTSAEVVFFSFGAGQGGDAEANLARWARQVVDEAGDPVVPEIGLIESGTRRTTTAVYRGTFLSGRPGTEPTPVPGSVLLGAVVEGGPEGSVFIKLVGPAGVVDANTAAWKAFLESVRDAGI